MERKHEKKKNQGETDPTKYFEMNNPGKIK